MRYELMLSEHCLSVGLMPPAEGGEQWWVESLDLDGPDAGLCIWLDEFGGTAEFDNKTKWLIRVVIPKVDLWRDFNTQPYFEAYFQALLGPIWAGFKEMLGSVGTNTWDGPQYYDLSKNEALGLWVVAWAELFLLAETLTGAMLVEVGDWAAVKRRLLEREEVYDYLPLHTLGDALRAVGGSFLDLNDRPQPEPSPADVIVMSERPPRRLPQAASVAEWWYVSVPESAAALEDSIRELLVDHPLLFKQRGKVRQLSGAVAVMVLAVIAVLCLSIAMGWL